MALLTEGDMSSCGFYKHGPPGGGRPHECECPIKGTVVVPSPSERCVIIPLFMYIDSHAHIEGSEFDADREAVIQRALDAGVEIIVCVGDGEVAADSHAAAFRVAEEYPFIYTTVGVHPHEARLLDDNLYAKLMDLSQHPKVIAWGEIGLDYHYDNSPREAQREAFRKQLRMA